MKACAQCGRTLPPGQAKARMLHCNTCRRRRLCSRCGRRLGKSELAKRARRCGKCLGRGKAERCCPPTPPHILERIPVYARRADAGLPLFEESA